MTRIFTGTEIRHQFCKHRPPSRIPDSIYHLWISKPIHVAAQLGIADILSESPKSIQELAQICSTHEISLYRLMRALACLD